MNRELTFPYLRYGTALTTAMRHLGYDAYDQRKPGTWSLETEVLVAALFAYDDRVATGYYTRGNVPKPKTQKEQQSDWAVFQPLLRLANHILNRNHSQAATESLLREAWQAAAS